MLLGLWLFVSLRVKEESQKACVAMSLAAGCFVFCFFKCPVLFLFHSHAPSNGIIPGTGYYPLMEKKS